MNPLHNPAGIVEMRECSANRDSTELSAISSVLPGPVARRRRAVRPAVGACSKTWTIIAVILTLLVPSTNYGATFTVRGWDLERFEPAYVSAMLERAQAAGMNTVTLSHEIVMNAEEILNDWHRYKHLRTFCDQAHAHNLQIYFWNHQINNPPAELVSRSPDGRRVLAFDDPRLWDWLYDRYQRVVDRVPNVDGIVLSLTESEWQIQRDPTDPHWYRMTGQEIASDLSPAERMAKVINTIHASLAARGKRLIVRDFLRSPREMTAFAEALEHVPDDVWVYTKCVPNDWEYRYPPHPLLGKVAPHTQIMELDLYNETGGGMNMFMPAPHYYQQQIQLARERGLAGAIARVDDGFHSNRGTPTEFNVYVYDKLLADPDIDIKPLWAQFYTPMYGPEAAPTAIAVLEQCEDLVCKLVYTLGFWTGAPTKVSIDYTDSHLLNHSSALWSDDPKYKKIETLLDRGGPEAIEQTVAEKRDALRIAEHCLRLLDENEAKFNPQQFLALHGTFEEGRQHAIVAQYWLREYYALRWYRRTRTAEARQAVEDALAASRAYVAAEHGPITPYIASLSPRRRTTFFTRNLPRFNEDLAAEVKKIDAVRTPVPSTSDR